MNIPGPVKNGPTIRRAFREGLLRLDAALETAGLSTLSREEIDRPTGCEAPVSYTHLPSPEIPQGAAPVPGTGAPE